MLYDAFSEHIIILLNDTHSSRMRKIIEEVKLLFTEYLDPISGKVGETLKDGQLHTKAIVGGREKSFLCVSVLPRTPLQAADYFESEWPPGYGGYLNHMARSPATK